MRPVKSEKEEVTFSNLASDASSPVIITIVKAEDSPTTGGEIEIGDTVRSVFCELNFSAETITNPKTIHWIIVKNPANALISGSPATVDGSTKRFILKRGMEMLPKSVGTAIKRVFVVRIPPRMSRFGDADELELRYVASSNETVNVCGIFIFRHYG